MNHLRHNCDMNPFHIPQTKEDYYLWIKDKLTQKGFIVNPYREIQYGLQFLVFENETDALIRVFESKKGLKLDLSQVHVSHLLDTFRSLLELPNSSKPKHPFPTDPKHANVSDQDLHNLDHYVGIDESGKGDYFGPLVVAAVAVNPKTKRQLHQLGVADSKALSDSFIRKLAPQIKALCPYGLLIMANPSYNDVYSKIKNLNHILAWGHIRCLENVRKQTVVDTAISDQFGNPSLIKNALSAKGISVTLFQEHKAERFIAVAAASILARECFITEIEKLENTYGCPFPKGCSIETLKAAEEFVTLYGIKKLDEVSKLHFKLTEKLTKKTT